MPRTPPGKAAAVMVLIVVGFNLLVAGLDSIAGAPGGARGSSYATGEEGLNAFAELLEVGGYSVRDSRQPLASSAFNPNETVVVLDPQEVTDEDAAALRTFVTSGGRLLAGGGLARLDRAHRHRRAGVGAPADPDSATVRPCPRGVDDHGGGVRGLRLVGRPRARSPTRR